MLLLADSAVEESMLLGAMGSGSTVELVYAALDFNLTESVRMQVKTNQRLKTLVT